MNNTFTKFTFGLFMLLLVNTTTYAQHYQFTQGFASPTYLNPAFTGANACNRLAFIYRDQWPSVPGTFITSQLSWDHYLSKYNTGIGFQLLRDQAGSGNLSTNQLNFMYAYEVNLTRNLVIRPAMQFGAVMRSVNYSKLIFGDQIVRDNDPNTLETIMRRRAYVDVGTGLVAYTSTFWTGFAFHHLTQPNQSLMDGDSRLPREFMLHGGYSFTTKTSDEANKGTKVQMAFNYKAQKKFDQLDLGFYVSKHVLVLGLWYRGLPVVKKYDTQYANNDALCLIVGVSDDRFNVGYSYDYTISRLINRTGGSHEITVSYQLCKYKKGKRKRVTLVSCPKF